MQTTLLVAGGAGLVAMVAFLAVTGVRDPEGRLAARGSRVAVEKAV